MENTELLLLILFGGVFALLTIAWLGKYLADYFADIRYVKMKIDRAYDWKEYVYWRRELSALRWSIIPGLTPHRVKAIKRFFYRGKHAKKLEKSDGFTSMLMPSVLGICICAVCLAGSTFAWFTATQSTATQTIQAANYNVTTVVTVSNETPISEQNGMYHLKKDTTYEVALTATGDATTGYCVLDFGGTKAYTDQIAKGTSITLKLNINEPVTLKITAVWGTYAGDGKISTEYTYGTTYIADKDAQNENNNDVPDVTEPAEEIQPLEKPTEHTVVSGDTLSSIASKYNTTVAKLAAYNNIENVNKIKIGDVIKIPSEDYVIPETTETTDPPQQTEEGTEPSKTEDNDVLTTETEVTAPSETEGNMDNSETTE